MFSDTDSLTTPLGLFSSVHCLYICPSSFSTLFPVSDLLRRLLSSALFGWINLPVTYTCKRLNKEGRKKSLGKAAFAAILCEENEGDPKIPTNDKPNVHLTCSICCSLICAWQQRLGTLVVRACSGAGGFACVAVRRESRRAGECPCKEGGDEMASAFADAGGPIFLWRSHARHGPGLAGKAVDGRISLLC